MSGYCLPDSSLIVGRSWVGVMAEMDWNWGGWRELEVMI
jgi:hypothetical protein